MSVPVEEWVWDGHAGHLIVGDRCQFHLNTRVGNYRISTVGEYTSDRPDGEGEYAKFETIGLHRLFETYVFRVLPNGEVESWSEIDSLPANDHDTATANHMKLCRKYARRKA